MCNIITYEAANLINEAIGNIRNNSLKLSDVKLSEYSFILKNTLSVCQDSLYAWKSYVFFRDSGIVKTRIPSSYYFGATYY